MNDIYKIYVDKDVIYTGDLSEVPLKYRNDLESALKDWGDVLSKRSLNELIYSTFYWYFKKIKCCRNCNITSENIEACSECGSDMLERYLYDRNEEIERIFDCIGMITSVDIVNK